MAKWEFFPEEYLYRKNGRVFREPSILRNLSVYRQGKTANVHELAFLLREGDITIQQWVTRMRNDIKRTHIVQYVVARGGIKRMSQSDWGRLGWVLREQYRYLDRFANEISGGNLTLGQIQARSALYINASRQSYERGKIQGVYGIRLPAYPGDGSSECFCITSPQSRVLTQRGWIPIVDVIVGDKVWTHKLHWKRVINTIRKPSQPEHKLVEYKTEFGIVGATDNHFWYTEHGWLDSNDIDSYNACIYHLSMEDTSEKILREVQHSTRKQKQDEFLYGMPDNMSYVWKEKGSSCRRMHILWDESQGKDSMAEHAFRDGEVFTPSRTQNISGFETRTLPSQKNGRWENICFVLGEWSSKNYISLSMDMDSEKWEDSRRNGNSSYQSRLSRRQDRKPIHDDEIGTCSLSREESHSAESYMSDMRKNIPAQDSQRQTIELLFSGMLPSGTTLYDITVEDDHSFCVEGLFAHNTNCRCRWIIEDKGAYYDCTWKLSEAEHCNTCVIRSNLWSPLQVSKP